MQAREKPARLASDRDAAAVRTSERRSDRSNRADAQRLDRLIRAIVLPDDSPPPTSLNEKFSLRPSGARSGSRQRPVHQVAAGALRILRSSKSKTKRGRSTKASLPREQSQRCAIRFSYTKNAVRGQFAAHGRYLVRDSAAEGSPSYGSETATDLTATLGRWQSEGDRRLYKVIVSPEFGERCDLTVLTKDLMAAVQRDLGRAFEWAAINHYNTDHPHVHIAIRSVDTQGRQFTFPREYVQQGIREQAERFCTQQLGHRTQEDAQLSREREVAQFRFTSLDKRILEKARQSADGRIDAPEADELIRARLKFLTRAAVVEQKGQSWVIPHDLDWTLRQMALTADRQRMLAQSGVAISDDRLPHSRAPLGPGQALRGRVLAHAEDERSGSTYLILEGTDGVVHFLRHDAKISALRRQGRLAPGNFIALTPVSGGHRVADLGDADSYLTGPGFDPIPFPAERATATSHAWRGWLGRYHQQLNLVSPQPELLPVQRDLER